MIGLPWEEVHAEACRWEHVMSEQVERRLVQVLDNPTVSPFRQSNPGSGAASAWMRPTPQRDDTDLVRLTELPVGDSVAVVAPVDRTRPGRRCADRAPQRGRVGAHARVLVQTSPDGDVTIVVSGQ